MLPPAFTIGRSRTDGCDKSTYRQALKSLEKVLDGQPKGAVGDSGSFHVPSASDGYGLTNHSPREQEIPVRVS